MTHKLGCVLWRVSTCARWRDYQCRWCHFSFLFNFYHPSTGLPVCVFVLCVLVSVHVDVWKKEKPYGDLVALSDSLWHHEWSPEWNACWLQLRDAVREKTLSKHRDKMMTSWINAKLVFVTLSQYDSDGWLEDWICWPNSSIQGVSTQVC